VEGSRQRRERDSRLADPSQIEYWRNMHVWGGLMADVDPRNVCICIYAANSKLSTIGGVLHAHNDKKKMK